MKKTLFLTALLGFGASAYAATDCLMPQTIIHVSEGTATQSATSDDANVTISTKNADDSTKSVSELMAQTALTVTGNRPAVVKDGQGTLVITEDVGTLNTTLVVREGTLNIKGATVSTLGSKNGNNLVIGGINAAMVLSDGASYTFTDDSRTSSSVNVGGIDGDGTLILTGGSTLSTRQTLFSGSATTLPIPTFENPYWDAGPHYGGTYAKVDGAEGNSYYRVATNAAGYSNQTTTPKGSLVGTAVINVSDGSTLSTGTGFYVGNTTLTIDNATVNSGTYNNSDNVWIGSTNVFGPTSKAVVNIQNGGQWIAQNGQYAAISYYDGQQSEVTISGEGSLMKVPGVCYLGGTGTGRSDIKVLDGGALSFGSYIYARGTTDSKHTILVDGEDSTVSTSQFALYGATTLTVSNGATAKAAYLDAIRSDVAVTVAEGGLLQVSDTLSLKNGATLEVTGADSLVLAQHANVASGATATIGEGAAMAAYQVQLQNGATLINRGTLYAYGTNNSATFLFGGSRLQTGEALISGCEELVAEGHDMQADYTTGLGAYMTLHYGSESADGDACTLTLGALLTGKDEMQYLSSGDMQKINEAVFKGLALGENAAYTIAYKHEIGKNITANYTTDHLNHVTGTESVAVNGGAILVEQGEGEHHVGTIGSYVEHAGETAAAVAVGETETGSRVTWQGDGMTTVAGENTKLISGTNVSIGEVAGEGTLTVVDGSTLDNNGVINAKAVVEQGGTLKGSGSLGATEVQGTLVVGNSPGAPTFAGDLTLYSGSETVFSIAGLDTPATATLNGWESAAYSHITITNGSLTLQDGARFTIEFGGALLAEIGGCQDFSFDLTLVNAGEGAITLGDAALTLLLDNTDFLISPDALAGGKGWSVEFDRSNMAYSVQANGSELHLVGTARLVPEPATATLSLLALAALATRRKRK